MAIFRQEFNDKVTVVGTGEVLIGFEIGEPNEGETLVDLGKIVDSNSNIYYLADAKSTIIKAAYSDTYIEITTEAELQYYYIYYNVLQNSDDYVGIKMSPQTYIKPTRLNTGDADRLELTSIIYNESTGNSIVYYASLTTTGGNKTLFVRYSNGTITLSPASGLSVIYSLYDSSGTPIFEDVTGTSYVIPVEYRETKLTHKHKFLYNGTEVPSSLADLSVNNQGTSVGTYCVFYNVFVPNNVSTVFSTRDSFTLKLFNANALYDEIQRGGLGLYRQLPAPSTQASFISPILNVGNITTTSDIYTKSILYGLQWHLNTATTATVPVISSQSTEKLVADAIGFSGDIDISISRTGTTAATLTAEALILDAAGAVKTILDTRVLTYGTTYNQKRSYTFNVTSEDMLTNERFGVRLTSSISVTYVVQFRAPRWSPSDFSSSSVMFNNLLMKNSNGTEYTLTQLEEDILANNVLRITPVGLNAIVGAKYANFTEPESELYYNITSNNTADSTTYNLKLDSGSSIITEKGDEYSEGNNSDSDALFSTNGAESVEIGAHSYVLSEGVSNVLFSTTGVKATIIGTYQWIPYYDIVDPSPNTKIQESVEWGNSEYPALADGTILKDLYKRETKLYLNGVWVDFEAPANLKDTIVTVNSIEELKYLSGVYKDQVVFIKGARRLGDVGTTTDNLYAGSNFYKCITSSGAFESGDDVFKIVSIDGKYQYNLLKNPNSLTIDDFGAFPLDKSFLDNDIFNSDYDSAPAMQKAIDLGYSAIIPNGYYYINNTVKLHYDNSSVISQSGDRARCFVYMSSHIDAFNLNGENIVVKDFTVLPRGNGFISYNEVTGVVEDKAVIRYGGRKDGVRTAIISNTIDIDVLGDYRYYGSRLVNSPYPKNTDYVRPTYTTLHQSLGLLEGHSVGDKIPATSDLYGRGSNLHAIFVDYNNPEEHDGSYFHDVVIEGKYECINNLLRITKRPGSKQSLNGMEFNAFGWGAKRWFYIESMSLAVIRGQFQSQTMLDYNENDHFYVNSNKYDWEEFNPNFSVFDIHISASKFGIFIWDVDINYSGNHKSNAGSLSGSDITLFDYPIQQGLFKNKANFPYTVSEGKSEPDRNQSTEVIYLDNSYFTFNNKDKTDTSPVDITRSNRFIGANNVWGDEVTQIKQFIANSRDYFLEFDNVIVSSASNLDVVESPVQPTYQTEFWDTDGAPTRVTIRGLYSNMGITSGDVKSFTILERGVGLPSILPISTDTNKLSIDDSSGSIIIYTSKDISITTSDQLELFSKYDGNTKINYELYDIDSIDSSSSTDYNIVNVTILDSSTELCTGSISGLIHTSGVLAESLASTGYDQMDRQFLEISTQVNSWVTDIMWPSNKSTTYNVYKEIQILSSHVDALTSKGITLTYTTNANPSAGQFTVINNSGDYILKINKLKTYNAGGTTFNSIFTYHTNITRHFTLSSLIEISSLGANKLEFRVTGVVENVKGSTSLLDYYEVPIRLISNTLVNSSTYTVYSNLAEVVQFNDTNYSPIDRNGYPLSRPTATHTKQLIFRLIGSRSVNDYSYNQALPYVQTSVLSDGYCTRNTNQNINGIKTFRNGFKENKQILTGDIISLDSTTGKYYNMSGTLNSSSNFTTVDAIIGGHALIRINTATEPTVNGVSSGKVKGSTFLPNTDMHMAIWYYGGPVQYNFIEL